MIRSFLNLFDTSPKVGSGLSESLAGKERFSNKILSYLKKYSDRELLIEYQKTHDSFLICVLMIRYKTPILGLGSIYLKENDQVEDFIQFLFSKLIEKCKDITPDNLEAYLKTLIRNSLLDIKRKQRKNRFSSKRLRVKALRKR